MDTTTLTQCFANLHSTLVAVAKRVAPQIVADELDDEQRALAYALCVTRGIYLMRIYGPRDWVTRIDLTRLDMGDPHNCVLGQLYDYYEYGLSDLGLADDYIPRDIVDEAAIHAGFDLDNDMNEERLNARYAELTQAWREAITSIRLQESILAE